MRTTISQLVAVLALCVPGLLLAPSALAQAEGDAPKLAKATATQPTAKADAPASYRKLAPGVMKKVDPPKDTDDGVSRQNLVELLAVDPEFAERPWSKDKSPAKDTVFRRDVTALEFAFKPVRFIEVDVPQRDGRMARKLVWYLVYSVRNPTDKPIEFAPRFVLVSHDAQKVYPDRFIPVAIPDIRAREDANRKILSTFEIAGPIPPAPKNGDGSVWGVATWEDIDPNTDYFSIYVQGLSNAYRWVDPPGAFKAGDAPLTGRQFYPRTLVLNFWRPSDREHEHEGEIRFVDFAWDYGQLTPKGFVGIKSDSPQAAAK